jgi:hypothetical protein
MSGAPALQTIDMGVSMETEEGLEIIDVLNEVSEVRAMAGHLVTFVGALVSTSGPIGNLTSIEAYRCSAGVLLHAVTASGPHWAVGGTTGAEAVSMIQDSSLHPPVTAWLAHVGLD